jgi:hypothetical protein
MLLRVLGTAAICASSAGCQTWSDVPYAREFPENAVIGQTLAIQIVRDGTEIIITNTTANAIPATTLWLNKWYSRPIDEIRVGETVRFGLREFRDEFSEPFPAGGFWSTGPGVPLVSAHIESPNQFEALVVVTRRGG